MPTVNIAAMVNPSRVGMPTEADWEAAIDGSATPAIISALIPQLTPNTYVPGIRTPDGGFKYVWNEPVGLGCKTACKPFQIPGVNSVQ